MPRKSVYYRGQSNIKKSGISEDWTEDKILEYQKCMHDPNHFIEKYIKIVNPDEGLIPCNMYPYQKKMIDLFENNRFNVILACRQSGKTTGVANYILWKALFTPEQSIVILANKGETARMIMRRIMLSLEHIPFFLQPGTKEFNKGSVTFENNTRIIARATTNDSVRGETATLLAVDELAFIENAEEFYTSTYPIITAGKKTKVIITSTPKGVGNLFHKIYTEAVSKTNEFNHMRVDWWDVPGRNEKWREETIKNTSKRQFAQEYENSFLGSGNTLIDGETLMTLASVRPQTIKQGGDLLIYEDVIKGHNYAIGVDTSKGRGIDYSAFHVIDISTVPWNQVAVYRSSLISPLVYPNIITRIAQKYNDAFVIVENNDVGQTVSEIMWFDLEYANMYVSSTLKSRKGTVGTSNIGIFMNKQTKFTGCSHLKDIIEEKKLMIQDSDTIQELCTFVANGTSWEADEGCHDDLVMSLVCFAWLANTPIFEELKGGNLRDFLYEERMRAIDYELPPPPVITDAAEDAEQVRRYENTNADVPSSVIEDAWAEVPYL